MTTAAPSAFCIEANEAPYKRSRIESGTTFGQEKLFTQGNTSAKSKKSAKIPSAVTQEVFLTPMNQADRRKSIVDPILDDDFDIPVTSQFNHEML